MSDNAIRTFLCLAEGENEVFGVEIAANKRIAHLKKAIGSECQILAKYLTLLMVTTTLSPA